MLNSRRVVVVEDERDIADIVVYNLRKAGYHAVGLHDGQTALTALLADPPDLIVLDVMLPGLNGIEIARQLRTHPRCAEIPIIFLTARADEADQLAGLNAGGDDYVTKPFSTKVLLARVSALLRRSAPPEAGPPPLQVGPVHINLTSHAVAVDQVEVKLTLTEYKLLVALLQSPRRVLTRTDLINRVMGPGIVVTARTIDVHIAAIRKKLGAAGEMIRTVRGVGYQLMPDAIDHPAPAGPSRQAAPSTGE